MADTLAGKGADAMLDANRKEGRVCRFPLAFQRDTYMVTDPAHYKQLYGADGLPKAPEYTHLTAILLGKPTLLTTTHTDLIWRLARKGTAASFSENAIKGRMQFIKEKMRKLVDVLASKEQSTVDLDEWYIRWAIDVVGRAMLNFDLSCLDGGRDGMLVFNGIPTVLPEVVKCIFFPFRKALQYFFPNAKLAWDTVECFRDLCHRIIKHNRTLNLTADANDHTLITELLRVEYPDENRASDVMAFLFAGHDTTGHTLAWTSTELIRNPKVRERLQDELDRVLGTKDVPDFEDLSKMPYLDAVVKESMRLWPVISSGSFRTTEEEIQVGEYTIPKDRTVIIPFYSAFRDNQFGDPDVFRPERWLEGTEGCVDEYCKEAFIPFSYGRRTCAAQTLGKITTRLCIATIFKNLDFDAEVLPTEGVWKVTLAPRGGVKVRPRRRSSTGLVTENEVKALAALSSLAEERSMLSKGMSCVTTDCTTESDVGSHEDLAHNE